MLMLEHVVVPPAGRQPKAAPAPGRRRIAPAPDVRASAAAAPLAPAPAAAAPPWTSAPWAGGLSFPEFPGRRVTPRPDVVAKTPIARHRLAGPDGGRVSVGAPRPTTAGVSNAVLEKARAAQRRADLQSLLAERRAASAQAATELREWRGAVAVGTPVACGRKVGRVAEMANGGDVQLEAVQGELPLGWVKLERLQPPTPAQLALLEGELQVAEARLQERRAAADADALFVEQEQELREHHAQTEAHRRELAAAEQAALRVAAETERVRSKAEQEVLAAAAKVEALREAANRSAKAAATFLKMDPLPTASWSTLEHGHSWQLELSESSAFHLNELAIWRAKLTPGGFAVHEGTVGLITEIVMVGEKGKKKRQA